MSAFRFIEHPADIEIEAVGKTFEEALKFSIYGMIEVIADRKRLKKRLKRNLSIKRINYQKDVYKILSEIHFIFETEGFIPKEAHIRKDKVYTIELIGQKISGKEDFLRTEIKAVTYHNFTVEEINNLWKIRVMFDT